MAKLTTKQRKKIPSDKFGLPKQRKYPMPDRSHAANAKARAQQQHDKGNLSESELKKIDRKANNILGEDKPKDKMATKKKSPPKNASSKKTGTKKTTTKKRK